MRPPPAPPVSINEPPLSSTTSNSTCTPHICRWQPYTNPSDFQDNVAMVLIILFCALICCSVVLNAIIRCFLRGGHGRGGRHPRRFNAGSHLPRTQLELGERKPVPDAGIARMVTAPTVVYLAGMKLARGDGKPECAICLSEFKEGDGIQVLSKCKHGFHVQCIQRWLASNYSCPTCRCICLPPSPSSEETCQPCVDDGSQPVMPDQEP